jgi:hypothetical protein
MGYDRAAVEKPTRPKQADATGEPDAGMPPKRVASVPRRVREDDPPRVLDQSMEQRAMSGLAYPSLELGQRERRRKPRTSGGF